MNVRRMIVDKQEKQKFECLAKFIAKIMHFIDQI